MRTLIRCWICIACFGSAAYAGNLERAQSFFHKLDKNHLDLSDEFYDKDAVFQDPIHQLKGSEKIRSYYENLYKNVDEIRFEFRDSIESGNIVSLSWRMHLKTPSINSGKEFSVDGVSIITFGGSEGKALHHRDYFDMGEFVYERVPILRSVISYIKKKMSGK